MISACIPVVLSSVFICAPLHAPCKIPCAPRPRRIVSLHSHSAYSESCFPWEHIFKHSLLRSRKGFHWHLNKCCLHCSCQIFPLSAFTAIYPFDHMAGLRSVCGLGNRQVLHPIKELSQRRTKLTETLLRLIRVLFRLQCYLG